MGSAAKSSRKPSEFLKRAVPPLTFTQFDWGADRYLADGVTVPPDGFAMLDREFDAIFVGPSETRASPPTFTLKKSYWACVSRWTSTRMSARCG